MKLRTRKPSEWGSFDTWQDFEQEVASLIEQYPRIKTEKSVSDQEFLYFVVLSLFDETTNKPWDFKDDRLTRLRTLHPDIDPSKLHIKSRVLGMAFFEAFAWFVMSGVGYSRNANYTVSLVLNRPHHYLFESGKARYQPAEALPLMEHFLDAYQPGALPYIRAGIFDAEIIKRAGASGVDPDLALQLLGAF